MDKCTCRLQQCSIERVGTITTITCTACGHTSTWDDAVIEAKSAADRLSVSRVFLGIACTAMALAGLATWHREGSGAFALALVGMGLAILSVCIRRRWIA